MADELKVNIIGDASKLNSELDKAGKNISSFNVKMAKAGTVMTVAGAAITAAFGVTIKKAADFQTQMAQVSTMLDKSAMSIMPKYNKELQKMSMEFGESTDTLAKGLYDILSASIQPTKALNVLAVAAKAATAGITDTGVAADAITTILNSYGMEAEDAGIVSDKLFAIVKSGKTTFEELGPAIGQSAALSSQAGLSFDELGAAISTMTRAGINTHEAMTSINGVLRAFLSPADEAIEVAAQFGLELSTTTLKTEGLTGVMEKLKNATTEQLAAIFPNIRGLKGMAAALGDTEGYARDLDLMLNSLGLTQIAFEKQTDTLNFKLEQAKKGFNLIAVTIGTILMPTIQKMIDEAIIVIGKIVEWTEKNPLLTEKIIKWGAALGLVLSFLGPMLIIMPKLIAAVKLLTQSFGPLAIGGAIILGLIEINQLLDKMNENVYKAQISLDSLSVAQIDAEIESLAQEIKKLEEQIKITSELPLASSAQFGSLLDMKNAVMNLEMKMGLLIERRHELTKAEEKGIDVSEELAKVEEEIKKALDEMTESVEETSKGLMEKLVSAIETVTDRIYQLTHTEMEYLIKKLKEQKQEYIDLGVNIELVNEWHNLEIKKLEELNAEQEKVNEEQEKHISIMERVAEITKAVTDKIYELTHTPYEVKLKNINEEYDNYIEVVKEANLVLEDEKEKIENINKARKLEIEWLDKLEKEEEKSIDIKNELADAYETIADKIYELTHTPMETLIKRLKEERQGYIDLGVSIELADKLFSLQILKLEEVEEAFINLDNTIKPIITSMTSYLEDQLAGAISGLLSQSEDFEWSWSNFWEGLKDILIKAVAAMIAKLIVLAAFSWLFPWLGIGWNAGGGVGYDKGGAVKGYAPGGGVDTVPARLTIGEYVISKPMTDFIRKFKAIPQNLISAVVNGMPTPVPAYASGGLVGDSGFSSTTFGGTKIYVDIHDNKISDDVDIRNLSKMVSAEILKKVQQNRKY